jgi:hypothetical protein
MEADEGQIDLTAESAISFAAAQARKENGRVRQLGKKAPAYWQWLSYEAVLVDATVGKGVQEEQAAALAASVIWALSSLAPHNQQASASLCSWACSR